MKKDKDKLVALNVAIFMASKTSNNCNQARKKFNLFITNIDKNNRKK